LLGEATEGVLLGGRLERHEQERAGKERSAAVVPGERGGNTVDHQVPRDPARVQGHHDRQGHPHRPAEEQPAKTSGRGGQGAGTPATAHPYSERDGGVEQGDRTQCHEERGGIVHVRSSQDTVHRISHARIHENGDDQPQEDGEHHPGVGEDRHHQDGEGAPPTVIRQDPGNPVVRDGGVLCPRRHLDVRGDGVRGDKGRVCDLRHDHIVRRRPSRPASGIGIVLGADGMVRGHPFG